MRFLELKIEGAVGFTGPIHYPFEAGLNSWRQKDSLHPRVVTSVIESLLYPSQISAKSSGPGNAERSEILFESEGKVFRVVRNYGEGTLSLLRLEPGSSSQYRILSTDEQTVVEMLGRSLHLPSRAAFLILMQGHPGALPTLDKEVVKDVDISSPSFEGSAEDPRNRLRALKVERDRVDQIKEMEFELDGLQGRIFEIDDQLRRLEEPLESVGLINQRYKEYEKFDVPGLITPKVVEKLKTYPKLGEKKDEELAQLDEKVREQTDDIDLFPANPFWKEPLAMAGAGSALVSLIASSWYSPLLIFFLAGIGLFVWGLFRSMRQQEKLKGMQKNLRNLENEKAGVQKRFEIETTTIRKVCEAVKLDDTEEILDLLRHRDELAREKQQAETKLAELHAEIPEEALRKERELRQKQVAKIEERLQTMPPVSVDPNAMETEILELETSMREMSMGAGESTSGERDKELEFLLALASDMMHRSVGEVLSRIEKGMTQNLATMTARKVQGIDLQGEGIRTFKFSDGSSRSWVEIDPQLKSTLYFAVQFTLWQFLAVQRKLPVLLDVASAPPAESVAKISLAAANYLAKQTQVLALVP